MCLQWGPVQQVGWEAVHEFDGYTVLYVSRIDIANAIIVGKYVVKSGHFFGVNADGLVMNIDSDNVEVLTIDEVCTCTWLPYTSGEVLPTGAVIGGNLVSGSPLYVAKMYNNGLGISAFGYYSTESSMGYYELLGARATSTMDILVIL